MCWADKLGVLWAGIAYFVLFMLGGANPDPTTPSILSWGITQSMLIIILPVWLLARGVDWIMGGPSQRRGSVSARVIR